MKIAITGITGFQLPTGPTLSDVAYNRRYSLSGHGIKTFA